MTQDEMKKKLPVWAKIVISLVILFIVGTITLSIGGAALMQRVYKQSTDPAMISRAASQIATFSEPVPKEFKYLFGFSNKVFTPFDVLALDSDVFKQYLMLMKYPEQETDSQKLVERLYEAGFSTPQAYVKFESVKSKGTFDVGGQKMPYILGKTVDSQDRHLEGLAACYVDKNTHKAVVLYGAQMSSTDYNLAATESLLKTIKSL